mmetsp:Transcript_43423/g.108851  ORF Transcript_43423/g.108851 Transcript_43423/m.108851 type:complete len:201 (+) Transcript_43423:362-964(+)
MALAAPAVPRPCSMVHMLPHRQAWHRRTISSRLRCARSRCCVWPPPHRGDTPHRSDTALCSACCPRRPPPAPTISRLWGGRKSARTPCDRPRTFSAACALASTCRCSSTALSLHHSASRSASRRSLAFKTAAWAACSSRISASIASSLCAASDEHSPVLLPNPPEAAEGLLCVTLELPSGCGAEFRPTSERCKSVRRHAI